MNLVKNPSMVNSEQPLLAREGFTIITICIAIVLALMNTSMFNLALPDVILDFNISSSTASWIVSGYSIMFAISSITFSRLSDFVPLKRLLIIGVLALGIASIVGFFSNSFLTLLLCRMCRLQVQAVLFHFLWCFIHVISLSNVVVQLWQSICLLFH
ncbi:MFS transporter [Bacillus sp. Au-Bac7]|uniref:MFS transporter n=1 Tax=Bacillus sp. Au-Bac7 TaxID=2906458 RepID=UPI003FA37BDA